MSRANCRAKANDRLVPGEGRGLDALEVGMIAEPRADNDHTSQGGAGLGALYTGFAELRSYDDPVPPLPPAPSAGDADWSSDCRSATILTPQ
jgi:hypothetical protein